MNNLPLTGGAAILLTAGLAASEFVLPAPAVDRTNAAADEKNVARAIAALKPNQEQLRALRRAHRAAREELKAKEKAAFDALGAEFGAKTKALLDRQAAEEKAMLAAMGE